MQQQQPGTHLETYSDEWRYFFKVHVPITSVAAALLVIAANEVIGCELAWPTLALIWALILILPLAWKLPPAPSVETDRQIK